MPRSRRKHRPISLLAFQDIIMSVTGIVLIMTLLLALELVHHQEVFNQVPAVGVLRDLRTTLGALQAEQSALKKRLGRAAVPLGRAAGSSSVALKQEISQLNEKSVDLEVETRHLAVELEHAKERLAQAQLERINHEERRELLQKEDAEIARFEAQLQKDKEEDRLFFDYPSGAKRQGWLVELAGAGISAAPLGKASQPLVFTGTARAQWEQFREWCRHLDERPYWLFLVRPSGAPKFEMLEQEFSGQRGNFGYDLIGEEQTVLDPQTGAFHHE